VLPGKVFRRVVRAGSGQREHHFASGSKFGFPGLEGNPDGTLNVRKGDLFSGLPMGEFLLGEFIEESGDGTIMDWAGYPVTLHGQGVGRGVGLDINSRNEQLENERARIVLVRQVTA